MFRMIHTVHSMMFLLKRYALQASLYSFLCFLARQIYYSLCTLGCNLDPSLNPRPYGYFNCKLQWILYPSEYFCFMSHHGLQKGVILGFLLALTLYFDCNPILFPFTLCLIGVPLQETSVNELARRLWLTKSRCTTKFSSERIFLLP